MTVKIAMEIMQKYKISEHEDDFSFQEFEMGILEVFDISEDYETFDNNLKDLVKEAIEDLFYNGFEADDKLTDKQLTEGFKKCFPTSLKVNKRIIKKPLELMTIEKIFAEIDYEQKGFATIENFEKYLQEYFDDTERCKQFATACALDADENRSGNVSKLEFIKWSETKSYLHFINVLEGKTAPDALDESPRSLDDTSQRPSKAFINRSKTMLSKDKDMLIENIFTNKNKQGLSNAVKKLQ